ncbi:MAG TPA: PQQ-dependent sugar dehydrogenase [Arenibaculum sp.]|nr:PQQ-dependent sugar dehydrogenase [Arenibaculum sp.]
MSTRLLRRAAPIALLTALAAPPAAGQQADDVSITVPEGFRAQVFATDLGRARHIAVTGDGRVYVALREPDQGGSIAALRDEDGDGRADTVRYFGGHDGGTGIAVHDGWLYASSNREVMRWRLPDDGLVPEGEPEVIATGFPEQEQHAAKAFTIDGQGNLFVNVGAPSNACQEETRTLHSPGLNPCPQLDRHAGVWRFDADRTGQSQQAAERHATGIRNIVALDTHPATGEVWFAMHGRDQLDALWPEQYTNDQNARLPDEEFHPLVQGADYGWPYNYWDAERELRMAAPEYGGTGDLPAPDADEYREPALAFPAHWAPNDLLFQSASRFPEEYRDGAFIAFHGSWNRSPFPQQGYKVVFVPFRDGRPAQDWRVFADGFAGPRDPAHPNEARYRPMGLAQGPDGSLFITDSQTGRIWKVSAEPPVAGENRDGS